jgi:DNA-binding MarR family transcriptional regulator
VALLRLFFTHPEERYYVRQIARLLRRDISGIKRELDNLEKAALLTSEKVGNLRYYTVSKTAAIYSELKSIVAKTVGVQAAISEALAALTGLRQAWLYSTNAHAPGEGAGAISLLIVWKCPAAIQGGSHRQIREVITLRKAGKRAFGQAN